MIVNYFKFVTVLTVNHLIIIMYEKRGLCNKSSFYFILVFSLFMITGNSDGSTSNEVSALPLVVTTWKFTNATKKAWESLKNKMSVLDAVENGCTVCEEEQCDFTVGFGGSPDEKGETTLDAMIMDGTTMNMGAVCGLRRIKNAIGVARKVLENTEHSMLAGELATEFAKMVGFKEEPLSTVDSTRKWKEWKQSKCQPNSWINVKPDPRQSCGPYSPSKDYLENNINVTPDVGETNHDTITMIAIDQDQRTAVGTSSNGKNHKIPGRVGDAPIAGAGGFADSRVGAAAATGDGDVMMRFLPSFHAVEEMRQGSTPTEAAEKAIKRIADYYPNFSGALIAANVDGDYGAACNGMEFFPFNVVNPVLNKVVVKTVKCSNVLRSRDRE